MVWRCHHLMSMTVVDDCLAEIGAADLDAWDYEHATRLMAARSLSAGPQGEAAREALFLKAASKPRLSRSFVS